MRAREADGERGAGGVVVGETRRDVGAECGRRGRRGRAAVEEFVLKWNAIAGAQRVGDMVGAAGDVGGSAGGSYEEKELKGR